MGGNGVNRGLALAKTERLGSRCGKPALKHCLSLLRWVGGGGGGSSLKGARLWARGHAAALEGVVVPVLGLAEFVEEEDDGLQAQDQHDSADEAGGVEGVFVRLGGGGDRRGAGVGSSCG